MLFSTSCDVSMRSFPRSHAFSVSGNVSQCGLTAWQQTLGLTGNGPKLEGLAWRHFLSRMARMAIPKFHALHQIQKAITLRSLRWKHQKKQETSQRQELKGFIGYIGLNTSRKSWKSSSWWGTFRTKHSTFGLFIRLGELNDDHDLEYRNKIHWWTGKICMKIHIRNSWMSRSRPPPNELHTMSAHVTPAMQIFTLLSLSAAQINWLLSSSSQAAEMKHLPMETANSSSTEFNWVQLGHPMPKRWWIKGPRHLSFCEVSWLRHHQQSCRLPGRGRSGRDHESWVCMSRGWEYRNIRISKIDINENVTIFSSFGTCVSTCTNLPPASIMSVMPSREYNLQRWLQWRSCQATVYPETGFGWFWTSSLQWCTMTSFSKLKAKIFFCSQRLLHSCIVLPPMQQHHSQKRRERPRDQAIQSKKKWIKNQIAGFTAESFHCWNLTSCACGHRIPRSYKVGKGIATFQDVKWAPNPQVRNT